MSDSILNGEDLETIRDTWLKIGLAAGITAEEEVTRAKSAVDKCYILVKQTPPKYKFVLDGPLEGLIGAVLLSACDQLLEVAETWLDAPGACDIPGDASPRAVVFRAANKIKQQYLQQEGIAAEKHMESVSAVVMDAVALLWETARSAVVDNLYTCGHGQHDAAWLGFYWAFRGRTPAVDSLEGLWDLARVAGWWWAFDNAAIITKRPLVCSMQNGRLHRVGGPALQYADGFTIYSLNGVIVPQWIAETPEERLDPRRVLEITNAEVRREFIRRVGIERICYALNAEVIDSYGDYELLRVAVSPDTVWTYLKMHNPSVDVWHVEGVPNTCQTVKDAICFRNGIDPGDIDPINGKDYFQQGDVVLKPRGKKLKSWLPIKLT